MAILRVSDQGQLNSAVQNANGGDTILLSSGTYNELVLNTAKSGHDVNFQQKVTIASADAGRPAVINEMLLRGAGNVELKNLKFDAKGGGTPFVIENTRGVKLDNVDLEGNGSGVGLRVKGSQSFSIANSEVSGFDNGLSLSKVSNVTISNNDFRAMSNDAMLLAALDGAVISGNDFRSMNAPASGRHKDMIQFRNSSSEPPSQDIVIRDNVIENPQVSHAIFFGNDLAKNGNLSAYYRNILIEDNYIRSAHLHGITMDHGANVTIRDNTVVSAGGGASINTPLINVSSRSIDVDIVGNRVASVPNELGSSWNVSGNVTSKQATNHWTGNYGPARQSDVTNFGEDEPDDFSGGSSGGGSSGGGIGGETGGGIGVSGGGGSDELRVGGGKVDGPTRFVVEDVDFSDGDVIVFSGFDDGTFAGARGKNPMNIWRGADGAKVDSALDLQELARFSDDISASVRGEDLVLRIEQRDGVAEVLLEGLGDEYRAADQPDLL